MSRKDACISKSKKRIKNGPKLSIGDAIDKISILSRKIFFGEEEAYKEHTYLTEHINEMGIPLTGALLSAIIRLTTMNIEIWNLENEIRKHGNSFVKEHGLDEVGRRALKIRDYNRKRVRYKNEINRITGKGFREFKVQHRSQ